MILLKARRMRSLRFDDSSSRAMLSTIVVTTSLIHASVSVTTARPGSRQSRHTQRRSEARVRRTLLQVDDERVLVEAVLECRPSRVHLANLVQVLPELGLLEVGRHDARNPHRQEL